MNLTKEQVEQWCEDNEYILISKKQDHGKNILPTELVIRLAANIVKCNADELKTNSRKERLVWTRWLVWNYYDTVSDYSLAYIGGIFNRDHSTVIHMKKHIDNISMNGWRKNTRIKFEDEINNMHENLEFKKAFK